MSKKKASKNAFHGFVGSSFIQKKKMVLGNVKHSGIEKNISLSKSGPGNSVYSDVNSLSGNNKDVGMTGVNGGSLLGSATTTPKTKCINTVEVSVRKSFALDINLSAVDGKFATAKTQFIRKIFSLVNSFGRATILSKFKEIIRSTFTSENSIEKAILLAKEKEIVINTDLKRQEIHSDWAVVIKKILINMPKNMIVAALAEFGKIKSIKIQLIELWQKAVVEFAELDQTEQLAAK
ncbi:hypothetical protein G9A89_023732 [Geosiphon pyriformis]|nr:hypothetical protein G9A89_023732 [Geosiphon pyriformis]